MQHPYHISRCLTALIAVATATAAFAAQYTVRGRVLNHDSEAEPYATLRIYAAGDSSRTSALGTADDLGVFALTLDSIGAYRLTAQATGQGEATRTFEVTATDAVTDLGDITLGETSVELDEVSVVAQRPLVTKSIDRIGYDVQADTDAPTSQLRDMLKKVPMVSVDPDGTIKVKGQTNFKIYKNGRPNKSFTSNAKDIFAAIPASSIKRIEVITDPGAREDAEGTSVILNIVTMDNMSMTGITGSVNLNYNSRGDLPGGGAWLMGQVDKVTVSAYGGAHPQYGKRSGITDSEIYREYDNGDVLTSKIHSKGSGLPAYWGAEASWEPDTLNLVTFDTGGWFYKGHRGGTRHTEMHSADGTPVYSYDCVDDTPSSKYLDFNFGANYQRSTRRKGENITLSYQVSLSQNDSRSRSWYENMVNMPAPYTGIDTDSKAHFAEHTVQLDWTRPFGEHHTLDVGGKYIYRDNNSRTDSRYEGWQDIHSDFSHITHIGALYADYRLTLGKWGARAGARYEYSHLAARFKDGSEPDFGSDLNDVVPSAAISYNASDASTFKLGYGAHINRPGIDYLNPAVSYSPTVTSQGNPNLDSNYTHDITAEYSLILPKFNAEFSAGYSTCNNGIAEYMYTVDNHTYTTYDNIGRSDDLSLSAYFSWQLTEKTRWIFNGSMSYRYLRNKTPELSADGVYYNIWTRVSQKLPWKLEASASLWMSNGNRSSVYSYTDYKSFGRDYTLMLRRAFLKDDALEVSLWCNNFAGPSRQRMVSYTDGGGYSDRTTSYSPYQTTFGVSIGFRFGKLNAYVKKTRSSINNDDLMGGSKAQSQGGK